MNHAAQASLFSDEETELDIAARIGRQIPAERIPEGVTHLQVRRAGRGWVVNGYSPAEDYPLLPSVAGGADRSGTWFRLYTKAIGQVDPPTKVTASRVTILVRDEEIA